MKQLKRIRITRAGLFTTVQDLGRPGYQRVGIPPSGALDALALRIANLLVGNEQGSAALEVTLVGPELDFDGSCWMAVTGADLQPRINDRAVPMWTSLPIHSGDRLAFGRAVSGCRSYLAFVGGIDVPLSLGSRSTYTRGALGGLEGRALASGDEIRVAQPPVGSRRRSRALPMRLRPSIPFPLTLRVVSGPQDDWFTSEMLALFLQSSYRVGDESDRMGSRLSGAAIRHRRPPDIVSDAVPAGAVQIPGDGQPILMLADRQTTGGYPKIGTVITPDLDLAGQLKPGDCVRFESVSVEHSAWLYRRYCEQIEKIREYLTR